MICHSMKRGELHALVYEVDCHGHLLTCRDKIDMATNWIKRAMAQNKSNPDVRSDAE